MRTKRLYRVRWKEPYLYNSYDRVRHFQTKRAAENHARLVTEGREESNGVLGPEWEPIPPAVPGSVRIDVSDPVRFASDGPASAGFGLGQRVAFTHVISRDGYFDEKERVNVRRWDAHPVSGEGVVYGQRTLSNGHIESVCESDGYGGKVYTHSEWRWVHYFQAYLVATDLRTRPIVVLPEHLAVVR